MGEFITHKYLINISNMSSIHKFITLYDFLESKETSWNSNTLATWCKELTHLKRPWCWERLKVGGEGDNRGWDGWMASPTQWTWVWVSSGSWWWTGKPGVLQSMGLQRVRHDWGTEPLGIIAVVINILITMITIIIMVIVTIITSNITMGLYRLQNNCACISPVI